MKSAVAVPDDQKPRLNDSAGLLVHGTFDAKDVTEEDCWLETGSSSGEPGPVSRLP